MRHVTFYVAFYLFNFSDFSSFATLVRRLYISTSSLCAESLCNLTSSWVLIIHCYILSRYPKIVSANELLKEFFIFSRHFHVQQIIFTTGTYEMHYNETSLTPHIMFTQPPPPPNLNNNQVVSVICFAYCYKLLQRFRVTCWSILLN